MAAAKVLLLIEDGLVERLAGEAVTRMTLQTPRADRKSLPNPTPAQVAAQVAALSQRTNAIHLAG